MIIDYSDIPRKGMYHETLTRTLCVYGLADVRVVSRVRGHSCRTEEGHLEFGTGLARGNRQAVPDVG